MVGALSAAPTRVARLIEQAGWLAVESFARPALLGRCWGAALWLCSPLPAFAGPPESLSGETDDGDVPFASKGVAGSANSVNSSACAW